MKEKLKFWLVFLGIVMVMIPLLAACGGSGSPSYHRRPGYQVPPPDPVKLRPDIPIIEPVNPSKYLIRENQPNWEIELNKVIRDLERQGLEDKLYIECYRREQWRIPDGYQREQACRDMAGQTASAWKLSDVLEDLAKQRR